MLALLTGVGLLARFVPPDIWWPPTLVALVIPWLLSLTALATIWLLFQRRWRAAILPVIVLLLSLSVAGRTFPIGGGAAAEEKSEGLVVLTSNSKSFKDDNWQKVPRAELVTAFKKHAADVLLLQEVLPLHDKGMRNALKTAGNYRKHFMVKRKSVAILAHDMTQVGSSFTTYNGFLVADVPTRLGTIRFISAHLESNRISGDVGQIGNSKDVQQELDRAESMLRSYGRTARTRAAQAREIKKYIDESPHPVILGGDLNDVPASYAYQRIRTARMRDAWVEAGTGLGATFTGPLPGLRIDFLMVDTSLSVSEVELIDTGYSDHLGLRAVLHKRSSDR